MDQTIVNGRLVELSDPTYMPRADRGIFERIGSKLLSDRRDTPFIKLMAGITFAVIPFAVYLFVPGKLTWLLTALYLVLVLGYFLGPFILMLHNTSHRTLFKPKYAWMRHYIPWVLGPFFGETPGTYYAHHIGMHHPENNLDEDISSTMRFQRDSIRGFARYFFRFFFAGIAELAVYLWKRGRRRLFWSAMIGELSFYAVVVALAVFNWQAALVVFVIPFFFARFAMMAGNWAQHAFIDADAPENCYRNSITCINCGYNRRCFNDGYHIGHHLKANRHWTEMPVEFQANRERYAAEGAIVFQGIDFFGIWALLMMKQYRVLAKHYVDLRGELTSHDEIIALLKSRTRRITMKDEG
jgi:fatty acid desaturase